MMMAFDSSRTSPSPLDDEIVTAVRQALRGYLADGGNAAPLRPAVAALAGDARGKAILPERLIVILKDMWASLAEVRDMSDVAQQVRLQQRVVTMCIKEYYST